MKYPYATVSGMVLVNICGKSFYVFSTDIGDCVAIEKLRNSFPSSPINSMVPSTTKFETKWVSEKGDTRRIVLVNLVGVLSVFSRLREKCFFEELQTLLNVSISDRSMFGPFTSFADLRKKEKHKAFVKELVEMCDEIHCSSYPCPQS